MARISWIDASHRYEDGVEMAVIFPESGGAIPWYGLLRVEETPIAEVSEVIFLEGRPVRREEPTESFKALVEAFTYPDELESDDHYIFGLSYRSNVHPNGHYTLNLVYNCTAEVPDESHTTLSRKVDPENFVWKLDAAPIRVRKVRPFSHLKLESSDLHPLQLLAIEELLYGTDETDPEMPTPEWIMELLGTWTFGYGHGPYGHLPYGGHT